MPKIKNRDRLRRRLLALPKNIRDEIKPALEKGATEITELQYSLVPVDTGALRASIDWAYGDPPEGAKLGGAKAKTAPEGSSDLKISIWAGSFEAYYARWVEFGTRAAKGHAATPAKPFFFGPYRTLRHEVFQRIANATNKAVKKAASVQ